MFGSAATKPTSSLFGGGPTATPSPFGGSNAGGFASAGAGSGSGLFGQKPSGFGGGFGSSASAGNPNPGSSLFGQTPSGFGTNSGSSLFGQKSGGFGGSGGLGSTGSGLFGGSTQPPGGSFGQGTNQGQGFGGLRGLGYPGPTAEVTGKTRVSQLPESVQKGLLAVEAHLREQRMKSAKLWARRTSIEDALQRLNDRFAAFDRGMISSSAQLDSLQANASMLRTAVQSETKSAADVRITMENIINATQGGLGTLYSASFAISRVPAEYFARVVGDLEARAYDYKKEIDEIAEYLRATSFGSYRGIMNSAVDSQKGRGASKSKGKMVEDILKRQFEYFMVVADQVASVHEDLRSLKESYLQLLWQRGSEGFDPFLQADRREVSEVERQKVMSQYKKTELLLPQPPTNVTQESQANMPPSSQPAGISLTKTVPTSGGSGSGFSTVPFGTSAGVPSSGSTGQGVTLGASSTSAPLTSAPQTSAPSTSGDPLKLSFGAPPVQANVSKPSFLAPSSHQETSGTSLATGNANEGTKSASLFNAASHQQGTGANQFGVPSTSKLNLNLSDGQKPVNARTAARAAKSEQRFGTRGSASDSGSLLAKGGYRGASSFKERNIRRKKR
eukprot:Plantae.Rhodophyta-Hildenbrandia_rubra.ctg2503.p1 GENE.Plantae.Rhodophyta-Hildenbrandia_rubra.ctg2503~~Plantae.Rhodophyta-Hildenbrandia_rubra.ctg2503.p1  ORF type:complete len:617 (-),score=83.57 Plantae.Rhodophyta-Hildenbrandia_rubra.ctg2503:1377-3227(-)